MLAYARRSTLGLVGGQADDGDTERCCFLSDPFRTVVQHVWMAVPFVCVPFGEGTHLDLDTDWVGVGGCPRFVLATDVLPDRVRFVVRPRVGADLGRRVAEVAAQRFDGGCPLGGVEHDETDLGPAPGRVVGAGDGDAVEAHSSSGMESGWVGSSSGSGVGSGSGVIRR